MKKTNLTDSILATRQPYATVRTGYIVQTTSLSSGQVQVQIGTSVITCGYLVNSYLPVVGDLVTVVKQDSSWLVIGKLPPVPGSGTSFISAVQIQSGLNITNTPAAAVINSWSTVDLTFPVPFSSVPHVVVTPTTTTLVATTTMMAATDNITTTGFTMKVWRSTAAHTNCHWIATT